MELNWYVIAALVAAGLAGFGGSSAAADTALGLAFVFWAFHD